MNRMTALLSTMSLVMGVAVAFSPASAATITGSMNPYTPYTITNLSDGTTDWVVYGGLGAPGTATDYTSKNPAASSSFSTLHDLSGSMYTESVNGTMKFKHDGGYGTYPAAITTSADPNVVVANSNSASSISFTHTIGGIDESLNIYVITKTTSIKVDLSAVINTGGSWSVTDQLLPTNNGKSKNQGRIALDITGAAPGDTVTFTITANYSGLTSPQNWWGIGLSAATSTVTSEFVPEPASMALLIVGGSLVLPRRYGRRGRRAGRA